MARRLLALPSQPASDIISNVHGRVGRPQLPGGQQAISVPDVRRVPRDQMMDFEMAVPRLLLLQQDGESRWTPER